MKAVRTCFLIADEKEARVLENDGVGKGVHQVSHHTAEGAGILAVGFADQPGSSQSAHGQSHGVEPTTHEREVVRKAFAAHLAGIMDGARQSGDFDRLVIAAAPQMLGALREALVGKVEVYADIDKNLVNTPTGKLADHFDGVVAI